MGYRFDSKVLDVDHVDVSNKGFTIPVIVVKKNIRAEKNYSNKCKK